MLYSVRVTEITPFDQVKLPIPSIGDRVSVYGVWVQDTEFIEIGLSGWYEIHPVRYIEINGKSYGDESYSGGLMTGVWGPSRLIVLDPENPYRTVNGTIAEVFSTGDGDYHVHVNVNDQYLHLLRPNIFATSLPIYQLLKALAFTPIAVIISYVVLSMIRPNITYLGRRVMKKRDSTES